ncbi:MAG: universal stress protein [Actinobacteria bacterium]|nr:universal stress protein [Actinomycetota bacterium]
MAADPSSAPILIAYDGSDHAKGAIAVAGEQFAAGRPALVVTVFEPLETIPFFSGAGAPVDSTTMEQLVGAAERAANHAAEEGAALAREAGFEAEAVALAGAPVWEQIVDLAEARGCEPIVIGSRGLSGLKHVLLGSVAAAVSQHSKRSTLIVHDR